MRSWKASLIYLPLFIFFNLVLWSQLETTAQAALKVHIPDQLDDVDDNEEDQAWKDWGKVKKEKLQFNPPPDFDGKDLDKYQEEMLDRQMGTSMGFVKLRLGVSRKPVRLVSCPSLMMLMVPILARKRAINWLAKVSFLPFQIWSCLPL